MLYFLKLYEISMGRVYCYKAPILWFSIILFIFILHLYAYLWLLLLYSFILFSPLIPLLLLLCNCNVKFYTLLYKCALQSDDIAHTHTASKRDLYNIYLLATNSELICGRYSNWTLSMHYLIHVFCRFFWMFPFSLSLSFCGTFLQWLIDI